MRDSQPFSDGRDEGAASAVADPDPPSGDAVVPRLLRVVGAGLLAASLSVFLFQSWEGGGDIHRYFLLLAQTVVLAMTGLGVGRWLGEAKSARVFVGLALAAVVANFAVLGGLIFSVYQWDMALAVYPALAHWQASSGTAALATALVATAIMLPIVGLGYVTLARRAAGTFAAAFLLGNAMLLLPVRSVEVVSVLAAVATLGALFAVGRALSRDPGLRTVEGFVAAALVVAPGGVMIGRGLSLYSAEPMMMVVAGALGWLVLRELARSLPERSAPRVGIEIASLPVAVFTAAAAAALGNDLGLTASQWLLPSAALVFGALVLELASRAGRYAEVYRGVSAATITCGVTVNLLWGSSPATAGLAFLTGVAIAAYAARAQRPDALKAGLLPLCIGGGDLVRHGITSIALGAWGWLALLGTLAVLAAALLERYGTVTLWRR